VAAPFLLTSLLLPLLRKRPGSRIINVSSISQVGGHGHADFTPSLTRPSLLVSDPCMAPTLWQGSTVRWDDLQYAKPGSYNEHSAYSLSKLLMVMYNMELAERVGGPTLPVLSCDPGTVNTVR
jgi:NAD(P)-dependent dehydrogenase (short-subunit alcohol dehydrogenase family)